MYYFQSSSVFLPSFLPSYCAHGMQKFLGQGLNLYHSSDNAESLTSRPPGKSSRVFLNTRGIYTASDVHTSWQSSFMIEHPIGTFLSSHPLTSQWIERSPLTQCLPHYVIGNEDFNMIGMCQIKIDINNSRIPKQLERINTLYYQFQRI